MSKLLVSASQEPAPMGGYTFERGLDPWHADAFKGTPMEGIDVTTQPRKEGWYLLDWCGNVMGFISDGTPVEMEQIYDSRLDTEAHIARVATLLRLVTANLEKRAQMHDFSKLQSPEKEGFDEYTPKLKGLTYGSDEYKEALNGLGVALEHHYAHNSHHPQHYPNGINGMSLFDLVEMFVDWKAAGERHADGNFSESLRINKGRFEMSEQLAEIFQNTRKELSW
jgi:hypothetical protein